MAAGLLYPGRSQIHLQQIIAVILLGSSDINSTAEHVVSVMELYLAMHVYQKPNAGSEAANKTQ